MQQCPHCGERVEPVDVYCFECGTALGASTDDDRSRGPTSGREQGRRQQQTPRREQAPGRAPGAVTSDETSQSGVESLTTLWVAVGLSVVSVV